MGQSQVKLLNQSPDAGSTPTDAAGCRSADQRADDVSRELTLTRHVEEFREERKSWELDRQREIQRLRREGGLLAEAWQRLEAAERSLLAERELLRRGASHQPNNPPPSGSPASPEEATPAAGGEQDHLAWLQFQQLRREFQRYGQRAT